MCFNQGSYFLNYVQVRTAYGLLRRTTAFLRTFQRVAWHRGFSFDRATYTMFLRLCGGFQRVYV